MDANDVDSLELRDVHALQVGAAVAWKKSVGNGLARCHWGSALERFHQLDRFLDVSEKMDEV